MLGSAGQGRSRWTGSLDRIVVSGQGRWTGSLDRVVAPGQGRRTTPAIVNGVKKCPMADRMYKSPSIHRLNAHAMDESGMKYLEYVRMDNALCEQKCLAYILQRLEFEKEIERLEFEMAMEAIELETSGLDYFDVHRSAALRRSHALCTHRMQECKAKSFFWGRVAAAQTALPDDCREKTLESPPPKKHCTKTAEPPSNIHCPKTAQQLSFWSVRLELELLLNDESLHAGIKERFAVVLGNC